MRFVAVVVVCGEACACLLGGFAGLQFAVDGVAAAEGGPELAEPFEGGVVGDLDAALGEAVAEILFLDGVGELRRRLGPKGGGVGLGAHAGSFHGGGG